MPSDDVRVSKTLDDAKNAKPGGTISKHIFDDIYDKSPSHKNDTTLDKKAPHKTDSTADETSRSTSRLNDEYNFLSTKLHEQGVLPALTFDGINGQYADGTDVHHAADTDVHHADVTDVSKDSKQLTEKLSWAKDITQVDGSVTQVFHPNGTVDVTAQNGDDGPKTTAHYQYDKDGNLVSATRTNPDGTTDTFSQNIFGQWVMRTSMDGKVTGFARVANLAVNSDGGVTYDSGNSHVVIEGYGATHITETTSYGTYEQSFDPSGKLILVARKDDTTGKTELISYINGSDGKLLIYTTSAPEGCTTTDVKINSDGSYSYVNDQGIEVGRGVDFSSDGLELTPIDPEIASVAKDNGVDVTRTVVDGKIQYNYSIDVNGARVQVLSSDGPAEADNDELEKLRDQKLAEVEKANNVRFGRDGESTDVDGESIPLKTPNLGQVYGVEAAVVRSIPDVATQSGKPLEIDFTAVQGSNPNKGGFADGSRVVIEPNGGEDTPDQVTRVFMHELAHNGQFRLYGKDKTFETQYASQFGFVKAGDDWLLVTKDGRYFKSVAGEGGVGSSAWVRTDKDGNTVDENGVLSDHPQTITNQEARNLAQVTPATGYFPNPAEAGAEATSKFRGGEETRADLLAENPDTYAVIKRVDQLDINKTYGLDASGQPNFIRNSDGLIVPNTAENRTAIKEFEDSVTSRAVGDGGGKLTPIENSGQKNNARVPAAVDLNPNISYIPASAGPK